MNDLAEVGIPNDALNLVEAVLKANATELRDLLTAGGIDPSSGLRGLDLRGWPLHGQDLRGFDFTESDLRGTGVEHARCDNTTTFSGALLDQHIALVPMPAAMLSKRRQAKSEIESARPAYTKVRVPELTDEELMERDFLIPDPIQLPNITYGPPPTDQWITYEGRYEVGETLKCAFSHRHKRGYVFRDEWDRRYLIGKDCGSSHLGLGNWNAFTKGRQGLEERAFYLRQIRDLRAAFEEHYAAIEKLSKHPAVAAFDQLRHLLASRHPQLIDAVRAVYASGDSRLSIKVWERDLAAERRRARRESEALSSYERLTDEQKVLYRQHRRPPLISQAPIMVPRDRILGSLFGKSLFSKVSPMKDRLATAARFVHTFITLNSIPTDRGMLRDISRNAKELVSRLSNARGELIEAIEFFDRANLERFVTWANHHRFDGAEFAVDYNGFRALLHNGRITDVVRPAALQPFDDEILHDLIATITRIEIRLGGKPRAM